MIDFFNIRPGDKVTVEGIVTENDNSSEAALRVKFIGTGFGHWIPNEAVLSHTPAPRPVEPGCTVAWRKDKGLPLGKVIWIWQDVAWVLVRTSSMPVNYLVSDLTRFD